MADNSLAKQILGSANKLWETLGLGTTGEVAPKVPRTRDPYKTYNPIAEAFPSVSPGLPDEYETNMNQVNPMYEPPMGQDIYRVNPLQKLNRLADIPSGTSPELRASLSEIDAYGPSGENIQATPEDTSYGYTDQQAMAIIQMLKDALKDPALSPEDRKAILEALGMDPGGNVYGAQGSGMSKKIGSTEDFMRGMPNSREPVRSMFNTWEER